MQIRTYQSQDEAAVLELWKRSGVTRPWNDPRKDIERKLRVQPELFFVTVVDEKVVGTIMAGYDGHRGWFHHEFYRRLGYVPDDVESFGKRLVDDGGGDPNWR